MKNTTITTVYKVLTRVNKQLISINKKYAMANLAQRYFTNRRNYPKYQGSKLFAFNSYEAARNLQTLFGGVIYECEASISPCRIIYRIDSGGLVSTERVLSFWKTTMKGTNDGSHVVPSGTVLCNWIEIVAQVG